LIPQQGESSRLAASILIKTGVAVIEGSSIAIHTLSSFSLHPASRRLQSLIRHASSLCLSGSQRVACKARTPDSAFELALERKGSRSNLGGGPVPQQGGSVSPAAWHDSVSESLLEWTCERRGRRRTFRPILSLAKNPSDSLSWEPSSGGHSGCSGHPPEEDNFRPVGRGSIILQAAPAYPESTPAGARPRASP
jgi:hypothetical protein